jgi:hypothetical protein
VDRAEFAAAQAARHKGTENFAIIAAAGLPWSTSLASSCGLAFLLGFLSTVKTSRILPFIETSRQCHSSGSVSLGRRWRFWADSLSWLKDFAD